MPTGICTNDYDPCDRFVSRAPVSVPEGADFECPECGSELMPVSARRSRLGDLSGNRTVRVVAVALVALAVLGGAGFAGTQALGLFGSGDETAETSTSQGTERVALEPSTDSLAAFSTAEPRVPPPPPEENKTEDTRSEPPPNPEAQARPQVQAPPQQEERVVERVIVREVPTVIEVPVEAPPPRRDCSGYVRRITQLSTDECPALRDPDRRAACYTEIERLRSELAVCTDG